MKISLTICLILVLLTSEADYNDSVNERKRYCDNVELFQNTSGHFGWPPYKGECDEP